MSGINLLLPGLFNVCAWIENHDSPCVRVYVSIFRWEPWNCIIVNIYLLWWHTKAESMIAYHNNNNMMTCLQLLPVLKTFLFFGTQLFVLLSTLKSRSAHSVLLSCWTRCRTRGFQVAWAGFEMMWDDDQHFCQNDGCRCFSQEPVVEGQYCRRPVFPLAGENCCGTRKSWFTGYKDLHWTSHNYSYETTLKCVIVHTWDVAL